MKKNTKSIVTIMALIGVICTSIVAYLFLKDSAIFQKLFAKDEDFDLDCFDDDFPEFEEEEETPVEEEAPVEEEEEEEEKPLPKVRRGYIPLKFND